MSLIQDLQALLEPIAAGGAFYAFNTTEPLARDAGGIKPYIVWQRIVSVDNNTLSGPSNVQNTRIQVDIFAPRIADAEAIRVAVDDSLVNSAITVIPQSTQDLYEEPVKLFRIIREYSVWATSGSDDVQFYQSSFYAAPGVGDVFSGATSEDWTHQLTVQGDSGTVSVAGVVEGTSDPEGVVGWTLICALSATGTVSAADSPVPPVASHLWRLLRHRLTALSGTNAFAQFNSTGA